VSVKQYLPSKEFRKKFIVVLGIAIVFFGVSELVGYIKNKNGKTEDSSMSILGKDYVNVTIGDVVEADTDGDGVRDFEEILYGTNPDLAETTPGIPDGQAVEEIKSKNQQVGDVASENINKTEQFAGEFISSIIALDRAGLVNEQNKEVITNSFFDYIKNYEEEIPYTESSFTTHKSPNRPLDSKYVSTMGPIIISDLTDKDDSLIMTGLILKDPKPYQTKRLKEISTAYKNAETRIAPLSVPSEILEAHTSFINSLALLGSYVNAMEKIQEDPLPGFVALVRYEETLLEYNQSYNKILNFLKKFVN
jgi:hypothetical protein